MYANYTWNKLGHPAIIYTNIAKIFRNDSVWQSCLFSIIKIRVIKIMAGRMRSITSMILIGIEPAIKNVKKGN